MLLNKPKQQNTINTS